MTRAERRRAEREAQKAPKQEQTLQLQNPVQEHFESFIFGNALHCDHVMVEDEAVGKSLLICGAGPSLADEIDKYEADHVWGCNSAAIWLHDNGYQVTHAFTVDQTPAMLEEWFKAPDVEYLLATTVHPHLTAYLKGKNRRIRWFHNFVGIKKQPVELCECGLGPDECECETYTPKVVSYEEWLYLALFPPTIHSGSGLNSVNRALDIAIQAGYEKITILGADCALKVSSPPPNLPNHHPDYLRWLREETVMHADGGHALASGATPVTMYAEIDGRLWVTKPDMAISSVWLEQARRYYPDRVDIVGDTLVGALRDKPDEFLRRMPGLGGSGS